MTVFIVKERREGQEPHFVTPSAACVFHAGDTLLVSGTDKDIKALVENL